MKHRYIVYFLILFLLVGLLCFPVSAKSVFDYEYTIDYGENGETFITVFIPLDNGIVGYSYSDSTIFRGVSHSFVLANAEYNLFTFRSDSFDIADFPKNSSVSVSAAFDASAGHVTPSASMFLEYYYNLGNPWIVLNDGTMIRNPDVTYSRVDSNNWCKFAMGDITDLGSMTIEKGDAKSFSVGFMVNNFGNIFDEAVEYTFTLTNFKVTFSLESAYFEQLQTGRTNKLLEDLKSSNKVISDKLDQIADVLEPVPGAGEDAKDNSVIQGGKIDDLNGQMGELVKPDMSGQGSISHIISPGDLTSYTTFLSSIVNAPYVSQVVMLALILSLAAYVLFGKRG